MEKNNKLDRFCTRVLRSVNPKTEKLIKEQLNPVLTYNTKLRMEQVKKVKKSCCVDSSYYLG